MTIAAAEPNYRKLGDVITYVLGGLFVVVFIVGGIGAWAATTEIAGAVLAPGTIVVESNVKKVQHPTGGVVGEIKVKEGAKVKVGDLLLRLDETITRANLQLVANQLDEYMMREARLNGERDGIVDIEVPEALTGRLAEAAIAKTFAAEKSLLVSRRDSREGQKSQLKERMDQLGEEIAGVAGQIEAKSTEIGLIGKELEGLKDLEAQKLVTTNKMVQLRREAARLKGEFGQLKSQAAQAKGKITEVELQILRVDQDARTETVKELREVQSKLSELRERRVAAEDQLKRVDIRAPQDGVVHQLSAHTVGGVITPSDTIMLIVPENDRLLVETRISPQSIDQVHVESAGADSARRLQPAHDAGTQRQAHPHRRRPLTRSANGGKLLQRAPRDSRGSAEAARRQKARPRHARRRADPHRGPHRAVLSPETPERPVLQGVPGEIRASPARELVQSVYRVTLARQVPRRVPKPSQHHSTFPLSIWPSLVSVPV